MVLAVESTVVSAPLVVGAIDVCTVLGVAEIKTTLRDDSFKASIGTYKIVLLNVK